MLRNNFYYKKNRLQQMRGFCAVARVGSVTKAALELNLTAASVSVLVSSLEEELGIKLFERRSRRGLELNAEGKLFYAKAIEYVQGFDGFYEDFLKDIKAKPKLRVAGNHICVLYIFPNFIKKYREKNAAIDLWIHNLAKDEAFERLRKDEIDFYVYPAIADVPEELIFYPFKEFSPILLTRRDHPLAKIKKLTLEEVAKYDLVRIDPHLITLPMFEETLKRYGLGSNIHLENGDWQILKRLVRAGVGVALISDICIDAHVAEDKMLMARPVTRYFPTMMYGVYVKKGKNLSAESLEFLQIMKVSLV